MLCVFIFVKRNLELEKNIAKDYINGINNKQLCEKYNKSRSYVQKVLIRHNIKLRSGAEVAKKYNVNENYFQKIDHSNKAYILGLIYSDGTITKNSFKINLNENDSQILYDIASKIYYDENYQIKNIKGRIKKWKNGEYYSKPQKALIVTRKKIVDDLKKYGLTYKKTFTIRFPKINEKFYKDFIRGYCDGDGYIYTSINYKNNDRVQITSNYNFVVDLKNIIETTIDIKCIISKTEIIGIYRLNVYGNIKVKKILDWMYTNAELKLKRKYNKACLIINK